jgi:hypothetical protein
MGGNQRHPPAQGGNGSADARGSVSLLDMVAPLAPHLKRVTDASGVRITPFDYLKQTPTGPFQVGRIYEGQGGHLWGFSGMIDFDVTAAAFYDMLDFSLTRDAVFQLSFNCDWNVLQGTNSDVGVEVTVGGLSVIRQVWDIGGSGANRGGYRGPWTVTFVAPASRVVDINVLNPDAGADLLQANVVLTGQFLDTGAHIGV